MRNFIFILLAIIIFSCGPSDREQLNEALKFAGENRSELEKVLKHYENDSLKLKAAKFLIENMPFYFSYESEQLNQYKNNLYKIAIENKCSDDEAIRIAQKRFGILSYSTFRKVYDAHIITADYLIKNIDLSFKVWKERPWGKYISFDDFCETILPYRIGDEPLEDWRETYYNRYQPLLDSSHTDNDPVKACKIIFDHIEQQTWVFNYKHQFPHLGATALLDNRFGTCDDRCDLSVYIMRALGISGGIDFILQHPDRMYKGHSWNYVTNTAGKHTEFALYDLRPGSKPDPGTEIKRGIIYRKCFSVQKSSLPIVYRNKPIPSTLSSVFMKNVSDLYFEDKANIIISNRNKKEKILYLSVFDNKNWIPVAWTEINNNKGVFTHLESGIAYMAGYYQNNVFVPASDPFIVGDNGKTHFLKADYEHRQNMTLTRKHSIPKWWFWYKKRTLNGKFQGANRIDFKDSVTLYTITHEATMNSYIINIWESGQFKYLRYLSGTDGCCNMAEVRFYTAKSDKPLEGEIIGTEGSFQNDPNRTKKAVFDNDPLTFYDAKEPNGAWAGLSLERPQKVTTIYYQFRNDDNNIRIGDTYELMYWSEAGEWESAGKVIADKEQVTYNDIPSQTLYLLHNHSRGNEERIFTYENGTQIWW